MNITKEQIQVGIAAGLALTNPESDAVIPVKYASGVVILHQLLLAIGSGQVVLGPAEKQPAPKTGRKAGRKKAPSKKKASRKQRR